MAHHFERVGDVEHVGFAARPTAVGVQVDGAALVDEAPTHDVRLLAVATRGKALACRGVEPVWPIWFRWVMHRSTASAACAAPSRRPGGMKRFIAACRRPQGSSIYIAALQGIRGYPR